jgi:hypothetical protein
MILMISIAIKKTKIICRSPSSIMGNIHAVNSKSREIIPSPKVIPSSFISSHLPVQPFIELLPLVPEEYVPHEKREEHRRESDSVIADRDVILFTETHLEAQTRIPE